MKKYPYLYLTFLFIIFFGKGFSQPLITYSEFSYEGAFRLPASRFGVSDLNYSQGPIEYNKTNHSLFVVGHNHQQAIAEFSIPPLVKSSVISDLNMASAPIQDFSYVLSRMSGGNSQNLNRIGGMKVIEGPNGLELLVNAHEYYDANTDATRSMIAIRNANNLAGSIDGPFVVSGGSGHTAGWISEIPQNWQSTLGDTHITGMSSGIPIIGRLSVGPSAFSFDPLDIVDKANESIPNSVPTTKLLDFSLSNPLNDDLNNGSRTNDLWTHLSRVTYGFIPEGTSTYVTIGYSGGHVGGVCYKCTQDSGNICGGYCSRQASDNYTYYWLWDVADLIAVKNGEMNSYDVRPYDYGVFDVPFPTRQIGGGSYDPDKQLLYLSLQRADREQGAFANPPIIVAYKIGMVGAIIASAGFDQSVSDVDDDGSELIILDASGSVGNDVNITTYDWQENGSSIASGISPSVTFDVGVHTVTLVVTSDQGDVSSDTVFVTVIASLPPVASAGPDQTVANGSLVTLDGLESYDPNDDPIAYLWEQTAGPPVTLNDLAIPNPEFTIPSNSVLSFELTITSNGESTKDSVTIISEEVPPIPTDGLIHAWLFEETSGNQVINSIDSVYSGALPSNNRAPVRTSGKVGNAISFDGSDDFVDIPAFNLDGDAFTLSLWMNLASQNERDGRLISKAIGGVSRDDHIFMLSTYTDKSLRFRLKTLNSGSTVEVRSNSDSFQLDTWHHVVVTYNGSSVRILVDGIVVGGSSVTGNIVQSNAGVALGNQPIDSGERPLDGLLDQVRIYNRFLNTEEITRLRNELPTLTYPTAKSGPDQIVADLNNDGSELITLDGSGSSDSDGNIVTYDWQRNGISIASGINPSVTLGVGVHPINLVVIDNDGNTSVDTVTITVTASLPPIASAGLDQTVANGSLVTLDGLGSYDPNGDPITYLWEQTSGPPVALSDLAIPNPEFTIPSNAVLSFELTITSNSESTKDSVTITSEEVLPIPTDGLIHAWLFEETSGNQAINSMNSAYNGDLLGSGRVSGKVGNAISFDGSDDLVDIPTFNLDGDAFTLSLWMNLASQSERDGRLISKAKSTAVDDHTFMLSTYTNKSLRFRLKTLNSGSTLEIRSNSDSFQLNTWHHVVVTYNGSSVRILVDGIEVSDSRITGNIVQSNAGVALGNQPIDSGERPLDGLLDQVRIYNRSLTTEEIALLRNELFTSEYLIAQAGPDQIVADSNNDGSEPIILDGSGSSDRDGNIATYDWQRNGISIASGINPSVTFNVGIHNVTLIVTDNDGNTSTDTVSITVNAGSTGNVVTVSNDSELQGAISSLTPDTTIVLAPGTYNLTSTLYIRVDDVTIRGATGNRNDVVLFGSGMENSDFGPVPHGIWTDASNLHIEDLSIGDVWFHPIFLSGDADSPHLQNLRLFDAGQQFVKGSSGGDVGLGCDNGIVENCLIEYTNQPSTVNSGGGIGYFNGVDVHGGSNWIIRNNRFVNLHNPDGTDHPYAPTILMWNGSTDTLVENNIFINCDRSIALGLINRTSFDHEGGIIRNNIIYMDAGLFSPSRISGADGAILVWDSANTKVLHNTILVNGNHPNAIQFRFNTVGSEARNNLMDATIRDRENDGTYSESGNTTNAPLSLFKNPSQYDLLLKADANVAQEPLLSDCLEDIQGDLRQGLVDVGADELVIENAIIIDSDLDGVSDLHEISMGTDPNDRNSFNKPVIETVNGTNVFSFQRSLEVTEYSLSLELSNNLEFWREATQDDGSYAIIDNGDGTETVRFSYSGTSPIFFRLGVEQSF